MKTLFAFVVLFLCPLTALAQQGSVVYEERIRVEIQLPPEMQHMQGQIPTETKVMRRLLYDGGRSLLTTVPEDEQQTQLEAESGGMRFRMMTSRPDDEVFTDQEEWVRVEKRDFMGRTFLIKGEPVELEWRLTGERAEFLGLMAQKAVAMRDTIAVEAWFTPEIPVTAGPGIYGGLPGLILMLSEDGGRRSFVAREIDRMSVVADAIKAPTRGREVTREAFDALVQERLREMGAERGAGGAFQIRMRN
jgi:GLPGLI family protein